MLLGNYYQSSQVSGFLLCKSLMAAVADSLGMLNSGIFKVKVKKKCLKSWNLSTTYL